MNSEKYDLIFEHSIYVYYICSQPKLNKIKLIEQKRNCTFLKRIKEYDYYVFVFLKNINKIEFKSEKTENAVFSIKNKEEDYINVLYGNNYYKVPIKVVYLLMFYLLKYGEMDITKFQKILNSKNINVNFLDKRRRNDYIVFWHLPNRIINMFFQETKIGVINREKNTSKRILNITCEEYENINIVKLWNKFLEWICKKE